MLSNMDIFSDDQAVTASAASSNFVFVGKQFMPGEPVDILVRVTTTFATLTSLTVAVQECDTESGSYATVASTAAIPAASLVKGYEFKLNYLPRVTKPYVKLLYTVAGSNATAGKIFAALEAGEDEPYRDGLYLSPRNPTGAAATA